MPLRGRVNHINIRNRQLQAKKIEHCDGEAAFRPVLVFLHEGLGCLDMWKDFPESVSAMTGCDALVFDRWGHGGSDPIDSGNIDADYHSEEAWQFLPAVLDHFNIQNAFFIGHSDGGTIALLFAAKFSERTVGIITEAAHVFVDDLTLHGIRETVCAYRTANLKSRLEKHHGHKVEPLFWRWADTWLSETFASWNIESCLKDIKCPVFALQGKDDRYGTVAQLESIAAKVSGPSRALLVPECGHVPHQQQPEIVLDCVSAFVAEVLSKA